MDGSPSGARRWKVVGGASTGGIKVREGRELSSLPYHEKLSHGALLEELGLEGERLRYRRLAGEGPAEGWVSIKLQGKELVVPEETDTSAGGLEPEEPEQVAEEKPPTLFQGEGRTLGGEAGQSAERLTPQEQRLRALEAAEKRQATMPGISAKKSAELVQRRQKEELLDKLTAHYQARGEDLPVGLSVASLEKLKQHWEQRAQAGAVAANEAPPLEKPRETASARLARDMKGREEKDVQWNPQMAKGWEPKDRQPRSGGPAEGRQAAAERLSPQPCPPATGSRMALPRDQLACASGCGLKVASRAEFGGYCCIACSEGGDHGPRCERVPAPPGCARADPNDWPVDGNKMEDLDLERAILLSVQEASAPSQGPASASNATHDRGGASAYDRGRAQEEEDLAEAIRISMMASGGGETLDLLDKPAPNLFRPPDRGVKDDFNPGLDLLGLPSDSHRSGVKFGADTSPWHPLLDPNLDLDDLYDDPLGSSDESDDDEGPPPLEPLDVDERPF